MTKEIITRFLHEEMKVKENITCHNFTLYPSSILVELKDGHYILMFLEIIELKRYNQWLLKITREEREEKFKQLGI